MFDGIVKVKLLKPVKVPVPDGYKDLTELELDFSKVNAAVINDCERKTISMGNMSTVFRSMSSEYCGRMAAHISGVDFQEIEKLDYESYDRVWQTVSAFVSKLNPQEFYNQFVGKEPAEVFTSPAAEPEPVDG